ncbi:hypothetical protein ACS0TY_003438 [Phlomoides rotata]
MEQFEFDTITTRVRHLRENITELLKNYDQLTLNVKVSRKIHQVNLDTVQTSINVVRYAQYLLWQALELPLLKVGSPSVTQKEKVHQAEPQQAFQVPEPGHADSAYTSTSSKLEENKTKHQDSKPGVSEQPNTFEVKEGEINLRPQTGPKQWYNCTWEDLLKGSGFRPEHFITNVSGKYPQLWALKGANPIDINRWYKFGALASICTIAPGF